MTGEPVAKMIRDLEAQADADFEAGKDLFCWRPVSDVYTVPVDGVYSVTFGKINNKGDDNAK